MFNGVCWFHFSSRRGDAGDGVPAIGAVCEPWHRHPMPHPHHRGPHPDDRRIFAPAQVETLHRAADEVVWLLGRGYSMDSAVRMVGDHHQLETRQRVAIARVCCAEELGAARAARALPDESLRDADLSIDGFNLIVTLETALGGAPVLVCRDLCLRDLAGLRGSYHLLDDTARAIALIGSALDALAVSRAEIFLESAVSNAGRLRGALEAAATQWRTPVTVTLVRDADPILATRANVITADAAVLDRCQSWFNLSQRIVAREIPSAWCVRF